MNIFLADDDEDDCFFFKDALDELPIATTLVIVNNGEQLIQHLENVTADLPGIIFLDLNMPRKNGFECLVEIKQHPVLKKIPVIIYSTSYDEKKANQLFATGAHYYICKPSDFNELKNVIHHALLLVQENTLRPERQDFLITKLKSVL